MSNGPDYKLVLGRIEQLLQKQESGFLTGLEFNILKQEIEVLYTRYVLDKENANESSTNHTAASSVMITEMKIERSEPVGGWTNDTLEELDPIEMNEDESGLPDIEQVKEVEREIEPDFPIGSNPDEVKRPEDLRTNRINEKLAVEKKTLADKIKSKGGNLKDLIGMNRRYYFIKELFQNHSEDYERAIRFLDNLTSLEDAKVYLDKELAVKYKWKSDLEAREKLERILADRFGA